jgi:hypothetical protein
MVNTIMHIITTRVVPDPFAIRVHVRRVGMAWLITKMSAVLRTGMLFRRTLLGAPLRLRRTLFLRAFRRMRHGCRFRAPFWNVHAGATLRGRSRMVFTLCDGRQ